MTMGGCSAIGREVGPAWNLRVRGARGVRPAVGHSRVLALMQPWRWADGLDSGRMPGRLCMCHESERQST